MRTYDSIGKVRQCQKCGLAKGFCICDYDLKVDCHAEFWLLTHQNELGRTSNTGRLIEKALSTSRVFVWERNKPPKELIDLINSNEYDIYLLYDRGEKSSIVHSDKKKAFIILDGTWKEVRKIFNKSDYLESLKVLKLNPKSTSYDLRRNKDEDHICTVEVAIEVLDLLGVDSEPLNDYFNFFMERYHAAKYYHEEVKHDN